PEPPAAAERVSAPNPGTGDLFYKGSIWKGTEQQGSSVVMVEIEVLERNGENFRADLSFSGRHGRYIEGRIKEGAITYGGAKGEPRPGAPHSGTIRGAVIEGMFTVPQGSQQGNWTFKFDYVPPRN